MNFSHIPRWFSKHFSKSSKENASSFNESTRSSIQVCLLGGHTPLGTITSLLLKQNPIISKLKIQGDMKGADIVLLLSNRVWPENTSLSTRILAESRRVYQLIYECTIQAPRAMIVVAVPPVSVFTPFAANLFKKSNFYHPSRIIGSAAMAQVKINSLAGRYQDLDPYICRVPLTGGPDIDLAVPIFSKASPVEIDTRSAKILMSRFRQIHLDDFPKQHCKENFIENHELSEAYSLNNMITTIAMGIFGDSEALYYAFVRSNIIPNCQYLVTMLQFSKEGVVHNFGLPTVSNFELDMLERAVLEIKNREQMAQELLDFCDGKCKTPSFEIKERKKERTLKQSVIK
ncbi:malate dehydrogenase, mitochondrial-like isoform X2 [Diorhabda carinulata]|uniref:malate dehydrogenase, mitochondrial-like isoform X2 n=1 Tax=Diorhabda carinulata TaxID=1163345 RepID=UPI0025A1D265|nr:malate dehydrogenase, mitochondrial-like isoform X2 [Diorhabda carinulata]